MEPDGDNDLYETIHDLVKSEQQDIIRNFHANLLERCKSIWNDIDFEKIYDGSEIGKSEHMEVIDKILKNLKYAHINNFKEISESIYECQCILVHLADHYDLKYNKAFCHYPSVYIIGLFMVNLFDVDSTKKIYDNLIKIRLILKLDNDELYNILEDLMV